ncbi:hypothetical protein [Baekduia sp. Peel2402]|uniref:hypothetical protein n=1 Tax=Baekduia sp. Peel2402 TaxID=3458296 RepID=UPI00403E65C4
MIKNPVMIAALAAAALALGACGSDGGGNASGKPPKSDEDKAYDGALKFAKCMRDNGIDMPDPQKSGDGWILQRMGGGKGEAPINEAKIEAAEKKCQHFMENGGGSGPGPGDDPKQRDAMLAYSKCMRQNGVPKFPDPKFSGNKVELSIRTKDGSVNLNPDAPAFKAAEKVCQSKLADVMGGGPRTAQKAGK